MDRVNLGLDADMLDLRLRELGADRGVSLPARSDGVSRRRFMLRATAAGLISATYATLLEKVAHAQVTTTKNIHNAAAWAAATFSAGQRCTNASKAYECVNPGTSTSAPTGTGTSVSNGGPAAFKYLSAVDFTSGAGAAGAYAGTLTNPLNLQFWNDKPGTAWPFTQIGGITNSSTTSLTISAAPGESFVDKGNGVALTGPSATRGVLFQHTTNYDHGLVVSANYMKIERVQGYGGPGGGQGLFAQYGKSATITNCLGALYGHDGIGLHISGTSGTHCSGYVYNCVAVGQHSNIQVQMHFCNGSSVVEAVTQVVPNTGTYSHNSMLLGTDAGMRIHNCAFLGANGATPPHDAAAGVRSDFPPNADGHCAVSYGHVKYEGTSLPSGGYAPTVSNLTSVSLAAALVSGTLSGGGLDLRLSPTSPLLKAGGTPILATYDIFGTARPNGAVDIGAHQLSVASANGVRLPAVIRRR